jgi:hypothetical protein
MQTLEIIGRQTYQGKSMNLIYRGKPTQACKKLFDSCDSKGTVAERARSNYPSDEHKVLRTLLAHKYVEQKNSGPRGGSRYHVTQAGRDALERAEESMRGLVAVSILE